MRRPPVFERAVAAVDYAIPCDRSIIDSKFHSQVELALLAKRGSVQAWEIARHVTAAPDRPARQETLRMQRVALVDDKLITGATALEASASLIRAGAAAVPGLTGARRN